MKIFHLSFLVALSPWPAASCADPAIEVKVHSDRESAGWAYKTSDYAVIAEQGACRIQWNAVEDKEGKRWLSVRRECRWGFSRQIPLHRAILKEIDREWSLARFQSIDWGPLCDQGDWAWCEPIAWASLQSPEFIDYYKHYPRSKLKNLNGLFVELANATQSYAEFTALMREFGVNLKLGSVEKVFDLRVGESPFAANLKASPLAKNPKARVMYNAGMAYFKIGNPP